ncbi:MAG: penicillin-binding protein 2 [Planctomycetes bacterium]|nr:penicillin-binding protein 2 [Planctomycetota bacterium]
MTPEKLRLRAVGGLGLVLAALGILVVRLAWLQLADCPDMRDAARGQHFGRTEVVQAERGRILDRNGQVLAVTEKFPSIAVDPKLVNDPHRFSALVQQETGVAASDVEALIARGGRFRWMRRQIADRPAVERLRRKLRELRIDGLVVVEEPKRVYPLGALAAQLIGFTDRDGRGLEGVEAMKNKELSGRNGHRVTLRDAAGMPIMLSGGPPYDPPTDGDDVRLTIDATIQAVAEDEANKTWVESGAKGVSVIVLDPQTGDVLAMASRPTFDPNDPSRSLPDQRRNRVMNDAFEPGSVFKPIVMVAALDAGTISPTERIDTEGGRYKIGSRVIHEDKGKNYGWLSLTEVIAHSSNVAMAKIGVGLGEQKMKSALGLFGFGARTPLRWRGEQAGDIQAKKPWRVSDQLASASFGHAMTATPAQLAQGYSILAAGGLRREMRIFADAPQAEPVRVVGEAAALAVTPMMQAVLGPGGTAEQAKKFCAEFDVAGKTGTAQKLETGGHVSSFACFAPANDPRVVVLVLVDEPKKATYGSVVAAPYAMRILRQSLCYLSVDTASVAAAQIPVAARQAGASEVAPR